MGKPTRNTGGRLFDLRGALRKVLRMAIPRSLGRRSSAAAQVVPNRLGIAQRTLPAAVLVAAILTLTGCGSSHPRTQVLRSANPLTSDMYIRVTGPGGAVSYVTEKIMSGGLSRYSLRKEGRKGFFVPPRITDRKICASTHTIRSSDAPALQAWRGRTIEITVYGGKSSMFYCAGLGPGIYRGGS
jgi:hypothetical protein